MASKKQVRQITMYLNEYTVCIYTQSSGHRNRSHTGDPVKIKECKDGGWGRSSPLQITLFKLY